MAVALEWLCSNIVSCYIDVFPREFQLLTQNHCYLSCPQLLVLLSHNKHQVYFFPPLFFDVPATPCLLPSSLCLPFPIAIVSCSLYLAGCFLACFDFLVLIELSLSSGLLSGSLPCIATGLLPFSTLSTHTFGGSGSFLSLCLDMDRFSSACFPFFAAGYNGLRQITFIHILHLHTLMHQSHSTDRLAT